MTNERSSEKTVPLVSSLPLHVIRKTSCGLSTIKNQLLIKEGRDEVTNPSFPLYLFMPS
jgi:hypothetical protein